LAKRKGLTNFINKHYSTENLLITPVRRILSQHKKFGSYKGIRSTQGLPSNGQRTHSNASTAGKHAIFGQKHGKNGVQKKKRVN